MTDRVQVNRARKRLAWLWLVGTGLPFILLLTQSLLGKYGSNVAAAWGWLLPAILPPLSLIGGDIVAAATRPDRQQTVSALAYSWATRLSAGYLVLVLIVLLAEPITRMTPLQVMELSKVWLAPVQAPVVLALSAFFGSKAS